MSPGDDFLVPLNLWDGDMDRAQSRICGAARERKNEKYKTRRMLGAIKVTRIK